MSVTLTNKWTVYSWPVTMRLELQPRAWAHIAYLNGNARIIKNTSTEPFEWTETLIAIRAGYEGEE